MNETVFDKEMKDMLHRCADELHAPDKLKTRVAGRAAAGAAV